MSEHDLAQDIQDINYKKDIATPFLVNDILEDPYNRSMNCSTPPSPASPNLLYSSYPRPAPPTTSMTSFSPATPSAYSHMHMSQLPSYGAGCYQSSDLTHYGDMRSAGSGWYSSPATDPRFATEYCKSEISTIEHYQLLNSIEHYQLLNSIEYYQLLNRVRLVQQSCYWP